MSRKLGGLGKGLDALFEDNATEENKVTAIKISEIEPDGDQPRKIFDEKAIEELAESVRTHGVLQPIMVRPAANGRYTIVAGERRWRAARIAGLEEIPVIIREMSEKEAAEIALVENLQRENLNPIEEARGYKNLIENFGLSQEDVAQRVGKSRPTVTNMLRLLLLEDDIVGYVEEGRISAGHARALLSVEEGMQRRQAVDGILQGRMTVRDVERLANAKKKEKKPEKVKSFTDKDKFFTELELAMREELRRKVKITGDGKKGTIEIEFFNKEELVDIAERLAGTKRRGGWR